VQSTKKGFWDNFTAREDRLIVDGFLIAILLGVALASVVFLTISSAPATQHAYLDWIFWPVLVAPTLAFVLVFVLPTWFKRRKTWFPVGGS